MYRLLIADDEMIERKVLFKTLSQNLKGQCEIFDRFYAAKLGVV